MERYAAALYEYFGDFADFRNDIGNAEFQDGSKGVQFIGPGLEVVATIRIWWEQLKDAVTWAAGGELSLEVKAPKYVVAELLQQDKLDELIVHLVNFNVIEEPVVENVEIDLGIPEGMSIKRVSLLCAEDSGTQTRDLRFKTDNNRIRFTVPELNAYAMLIIK